jgi:hypothetical protein
LLIWAVLVAMPQAQAKKSLCVAFFKKRSLLVLRKLGTDLAPNAPTVTIDPSRVCKAEFGILRAPEGKRNTKIHGWKL